MHGAENPTASGPSTSARLLLLVALALAIGLVTAGGFKLAVEAVLPGSQTLQQLLRYTPAAGSTADRPDVPYTWDLARGVRRYLLLVAVVMFVSFRRWVPWRTLGRKGLANAERPWLDLGLGALLASGLIVGYWLALALAGFATWSPRPLTYLAGKVPNYLLSALAIALLEELFFRGVMLRAMLRDWGACRALTISSLIYALLHFLTGTMQIAPGWQPLVGWNLLRAYLGDDNGSIVPDLRLVVGLFLLGCILGWLYLRTGSLWAPIGLHWGLVFLSKLAKKLMARSDVYPEWAFGDTVFMVSGVVAWAALALTLLALPWVTRSGPLARRLARSRRT